MLYTLKTHVHLPGTLDTRYQRLLRFVQFELPDACFARFALSFLPEGELWLILDRTNWKLGSQDVNILLLSAVWNGFSLPLMWTLIPHGGSSNSATRQALVERFERPVQSARLAVCSQTASLSAKRGLSFSSSRALPRVSACAPTQRWAICLSGPALRTSSTTNSGSGIVHSSFTASNFGYWEPKTPQVRRFFWPIRGRGQELGPLQFEMASRKPPQCVENTRLQSGGYRPDPR